METKDTLHAAWFKATWNEERSVVLKATSADDAMCRITEERGPLRGLKVVPIEPDSLGDTP